MNVDTFSPSRGSVFASLATLAWISLPSGVFLALNGSPTMGVLLALAGVVLAAVAASGGAINTFVDREIAKSRGYFMVFGMAASVLFSSLFSLSLFQLSGSTALFGTVHAVGIFLLGTWATVELLRSIRREGT